MDNQPDRPARRELRLWPGLALALVVLVARYVAPVLAPTSDAVTIIGILVGALGGILVLLWWLLFSRAPWRDRLLVLATVVVVFGLLPYALHPSIGKGAMGTVYKARDPLLDRTVALKTISIAANDPDLANTLNNLAALLQARNKLEEAEPLFREALAMRREALPAVGVAETCAELPLVPAELTARTTKK